MGRIASVSFAVCVVLAAVPGASDVAGGKDPDPGNPQAIRAKNRRVALRKL